MRINFCGNYLCELVAVKIKILQHLILVNAMTKKKIAAFIIVNDRLLRILRIQFLGYRFDKVLRVVSKLKSPFFAIGVLNINYDLPFF